jgi:GTP-binding protein
VLIHILDPLRINPEEPTRDLEKIKKELRAFDRELAKKPQLIALGKMDLAEGAQALAALKKAKPRTKILTFSSATGEGLLNLKRAIWQHIDKYRKNIKPGTSAPKTREVRNEQSGTGPDQRF